jgi:hypothetical protein
MTFHCDKLINAAAVIESVEVCFCAMHLPPSLLLNNKRSSNSQPNASSTPNNASTEAEAQGEAASPSRLSAHPESLVTNPRTQLARLVVSGVATGEVGGMEVVGDAGASEGGESIDERGVNGRRTTVAALLSPTQYLVRFVYDTSVGKLFSLHDKNYRAHMKRLLDDHVKRTRRRVRQLMDEKKRAEREKDRASSKGDGEGGQSDRMGMDTDMGLRHVSRRSDDDDDEESRGSSSSVESEAEPEIEVGHTQQQQQPKRRNNSDGSNGSGSTVEPAAAGGVPAAAAASGGLGQGQQHDAVVSGTTATTAAATAAATTTTTTTNHIIETGEEVEIVAEGDPIHIHDVAQPRTITAARQEVGGRCRRAQYAGFRKNGMLFQLVGVGLLWPVVPWPVV